MKSGDGAISLGGKRPSSCSLALRLSDSQTLRIRATYVTNKEKFKLNSDFLDNIARTPGENRKDGRPSIYVVTPNNFNPTLLPSELAKIDNTVARSATRLGRKGSDARRRVLGTKESRPNINSALRPQNLRKCAFCKAVKKLRELHSCNR